jgi:hypothetical protein
MAGGGSSGGGASRPAPLSADTFRTVIEVSYDAGSALSVL